MDEDERSKEGDCVNENKEKSQKVKFENENMDVEDALLDLLKSDS